MKKTPKELKDNYIVIQSWMSRTLNLKGNSLIIYALIYGFSQTDKQLCTCGDDYMAAWINGTTRGVLNIKNELIQRGLIEKVDAFDGDKRVAGYRALPIGIPEKSSDIIKKTSEKSSYNSRGKHPKSFPKIPEKSSPDNKYIINNNTDLSVSHSARGRETDGLTDENAIELYGEDFVQAAKKKGLTLKAAWYIDCARGHIERVGMSPYDYPANRFLEIYEALARKETVKVNGTVLSSEEILQALIPLASDEARLASALAKTLDGEREVKNKLGYAISTLYNCVKYY